MLVKILWRAYPDTGTERHTDADTDGMAHSKVSVLPGLTCRHNVTKINPHTLDAEAGRQNIQDQLRLSAYNSCLQD